MTPLIAALSRISNVAHTHESILCRLPTAGVGRAQPCSTRILRFERVSGLQSRVQVKHRLKIAWEDLREVNPRLVYGSISSFGQTGPYAERAGVDQIRAGNGRTDVGHR